MFAAAGSSAPKYFLDSGGWILVTVGALAATALLADDNPVANLLISWALVGTVAIYFPGLFQRKLAMGLSVPWAILAAYGVAVVLKNQERSIKTMGTALAIVLLGATSLRWFARELQFIKTDTSRTSVQNVYLDADTHKIMDYLNGLTGKHVLIAPPGRPSAAFAQAKQETGEIATAPFIADLNPVASGLTGIYTYAGHWSETPDYPKRRGVLERVYFGKDMPPDQRFNALKQTGADYAIDLAPSIYKDNGLVPFLPPFGDVVVEGSRFRLIHLNLPK
jgi:arabinosyltransferase C